MYWIGMTRLFVVGCAALFGACVCAYAMDPQFVYPVPATPPVFNPSHPYTVAQPPYTPISPTTPSVFSGSDLSIPLTRSHRRFTHSHRRTATLPSKVAKVRTQEVPTLPVEKLCRATSTQNLIPLAAEGDAKAAFAQCIQAEQSLREQVTKAWANFSQADKQHCVSLVLMGGSASYAELITCLEMARDVRDLKSASSALPQSSTLSQSSAANTSVPKVPMPTAGAAAVQPPVNQSQSTAKVQDEIDQARIDAETAKRSEAMTRRKLADAEATIQRLQGEAERATAEAERAKADAQTARAALALAQRKLDDAESAQLRARDRTADKENLEEPSRLILVVLSSIIIIGFYLLHKLRVRKDKNAVAALSEVRSPAMVPELKSCAENVLHTAADSVH